MNHQKLPIGGENKPVNNYFYHWSAENCIHMSKYVFHWEWGRYEVFFKLKAQVKSQNVKSTASIGLMRSLAQGHFCEADVLSAMETARCNKSLLRFGD